MRPSLAVGEYRIALALLLRAGQEHLLAGRRCMLLQPMRDALLENDLAQGVPIRARRRRGDKPNTCNAERR